MPNHLHGIIEILEYPGERENWTPAREIWAPTRGAPTVADEGESGESSQRRSLGEIIGAFKSKTTNTYIKMVKNGTLPPFEKRIWQRNYYEHIIRNENDYVCLIEYIQNNPAKWELDRFYTS